MPPLRLLRRTARAFSILTIAGAALLFALVAILWLEHRTDLTLPTPSGSFPVGRTIEAWSDDTPDTLAPIPGARRELVVWIWYPADHSAGATAGYVTDAWRQAIERTRGAVFGRLLTRDLSKVRTHSLSAVGVARAERSFPVVIIRAGASAEMFNYTTLAEDLASHGYVVVGFDAPYRTGIVVFPDGRVILRTPENNGERCLKLSGAERARCVDRILAAWTADTSFVLDRLQRLNSSDRSGRFTGRLDMSRVGLAGHSFGGATALEFCSEDPRCKAGIDIDGAPLGSVVRTGLHQPFMFLGSDHGNESDPEAPQIKADIAAIFDRLPADRRVVIMIRGANHFLFGDDWSLLKSRVALRILRLLHVVRIDGRRQLAVAAYCVHRFFDVYLKGAGGAAPLDPRSPAFPEIEPFR